MRCVGTQAALDQALSAAREGGNRVALVPTMGNLHAGHFKLIERARELAPVVVASVFVNPLQFGAGEDYARYPRTLQADVEALTAAGCDLLFAPAEETIYPNGYPPATRVRLESPLAEQLEGAFRPGHFDGVATVVNILFNRVRPDIAVFGEKDYQQLAVIRRMVSDLGLPVAVHGVPTVREADGLALSSRNQYLSAEQRRRAPRLYATLATVAERLRSGARDFAGLEREAMRRLREHGFAPDYVAIRRSDLSAPLAADCQFVILAAARLGDTRLIDNLRVGAVGVAG